MTDEVEKSGLGQGQPTYTDPPTPKTPPIVPVKTPDTPAENPHIAGHKARKAGGGAINPHKRLLPTGQVNHAHFEWNAGFADAGYAMAVEAEEKRKFDEASMPADKRAALAKAKADKIAKADADHMKAVMAANEIHDKALAEANKVP